MRRTLPALFAFALLVLPAAPAFAQTPEVSALKKSCDKESNAADCHKLAGLYAKGEGPHDLGKAAGFIRRPAMATTPGLLRPTPCTAARGIEGRPEGRAAGCRGCDLGNPMAARSSA
jgi:hypothetical protein